ncbi:hypothetical protein PQI07_28405 [Methylobacterium sp. 092160098-2]|uniref:hypothetical protein n=1 Tax=Methylobacterium sp. 092160098-2 TaxID=3025129 RepID=UPI002381A5C2|nr:hypothetical protein [Methylobacterium sp. 092160098-2]MDE4914588.1 hypothetical protein [Methylobacterium sp. 092160098-2]
MKIVAARAMAIGLMLLVLGTARWLEQLGTSLVFEGCLAAAIAATVVVVLARW